MTLHCYVYRSCIVCKHLINVCASDCNRYFEFSCIFSTAVRTAVLMQSVLCKPYIFTKHLSATGNVPPNVPPCGRDLWWKVAVLHDRYVYVSRTERGKCIAVATRSLRCCSYHDAHGHQLKGTAVLWKWY